MILQRFWCPPRSFIIRDLTTATVGGSAQTNATNGEKKEIHALIGEEEQAGKKKQKCKIKKKGIVAGLATDKPPPLRISYNCDNPHL